MFKVRMSLKGVTRIVFIFSRFVIKIPRHTHEHSHFISGCLANWNERQYCKMFKGLPEFYDKVAPTIFCSWFGLIQIQRKCEPLLRDLSESELNYLRDTCKGDIKKENFGYYKGRIVCLDY